MEKFGKSLKSGKFGIIFKNIFYRSKMKTGKFLKICWNLGKVDKSGKNCERKKKFGKSLKSEKYGIILKNIFYRGKMKTGKDLKNMLEFGESGKIW